MLINEVERLSAAWQLLDEQNRDKVLNLVLYEEKLTKLVTEVWLLLERLHLILRDWHTEIKSGQQILCCHASKRSTFGRESGLDESGRATDQSHRIFERDQGCAPGAASEWTIQSDDLVG